MIERIIRVLAKGAHFSSEWAQWSERKTGYRLKYAHEWRFEAVWNRLVLKKVGLAVRDGMNYNAEWKGTRFLVRVKDECWSDNLLQRCEKSMRGSCEGLPGM